MGGGDGNGPATDETPIKRGWGRGLEQEGTEGTETRISLMSTNWEQVLSTDGHG